jgi:hypothetical protein
MICNPHKIIFGRSNQKECEGWGMWHVQEREKVNTGFW